MSPRPSRPTPAEERRGDVDGVGLLGRIADGDEAAFRAFYRAHSAAGYGMALHVLRDHDLAQDVLQEGFLQVWQNAHSYDPQRSSPRAWVMTLLHRRAVDRVRREESYRRRHQQQRLPDTAEDATHARLLQHDVRQALASLTALQREAIELAYFSGLTRTEVAAALGVPEGTAKTRIRDGLVKLRTVMEVDGDE